MSEELKATVWYTFGNIIQKIAPWLVMVILTHSLSTSDYGIYSIFLSWLEIFEIIITLRIYSNGYVAGLVREDGEDNKKRYTATMQSLSYLLVSFWMIIYLIFHDAINKFTGMGVTISVLMILSYYGTISFGLWSSRMRVENKYKSILGATLIYGVLGPIIGALTVYCNFQNPILWVIAVRILIQAVVVIPFIISNNYNASRMFDKHFAVEAIKYNLPLVPYYLSMVLLNHSDRLMIQKFSGYSDAAKYSVAYSAAMMIFVISGAFNLSLQTWLFKALKEYNRKRQSNVFTYSTIIIAVVCLIAVILAPEIIFILGGKKYIDSIWVMPPVIISVLIMFIYQQFVNVLFYYKRTGLIMFCSIFAAGLNIILNYFFIPMFGYVAAGYTTFASYIIVMIIYTLMMVVVCKSSGIDYSDFFDIRKEGFILLLTIVICALMTIIYNYRILRYSLITIIVIAIYLERKKIISIIRMR